MQLMVTLVNENKAHKKFGCEVGGCRPSSCEVGRSRNLTRRSLIRWTRAVRGWARRLAAESRVSTATAVLCLALPGAAGPVVDAPGRVPPRACRRSTVRARQVSDARGHRRPSIVHCKSCNRCFTGGALALNCVLR